MEVRAKSEGWRLATTVNSGERHPFYMVAGVAPHSDKAAIAHVINLARSHSKFHQNALRIAAESLIRTTLTKKAKA